MILRLFCLVACLAATPLRSEEAQSFTLSVAPEIAGTGLLEYMLPRFSLKTGRKAVVVASGGDASLHPVQTGAPAQLARDGVPYALTLLTGNSAAALFAGWLASDPGQAAITGFEPDAGAPFTVPARAEAFEEVRFEGDATLGIQVARRHCARCHSVDDSGALAMGQAPSFAVLRALSDWSERLTTFFLRAPHPAFVQVAGLSAPFDPASPPAIVPLVITTAEFDALLAYASTVAPADLGAEIESR